MSNQQRGETAVTFKGEDIQLRLPINSICELEDKSGKSISEFSKLLDDANVPPRMTDLRLVTWAMMIDARPDTTLAEAGELIGELGDDFGPILEAAFENNFPDSDKTTSGADEKK